MAFTFTHTSVFGKHYPIMVPTSPLRASNNHGLLASVDHGMFDCVGIIFASFVATRFAGAYKML